MVLDNSVKIRIDTEARQWRKEALKKDGIDGDIEDLPLTYHQKLAVLEHIARILQDIKNAAIGDSPCCKSYDPLLIEGNTAHSYVYDLADGGRHHKFKSLNDLERMMIDEIKKELKDEEQIPTPSPVTSQIRELDARRISRGKKIFAANDEIEFQREAGYNPPWEPGIYRMKEVGWKGWHSVIDTNGYVVFVPTRRLRRRT